MYKRQAITFHGVRLEAGDWQQDEGSFKRLTFEIGMQTNQGEYRTTFARETVLTRDEDPFTVGAFVPGTLKRDIVVPLDANNLVPAPLSWVAIKLRNALTNANLPITLAIEGVSCFTSDISIGGRAIRLGTPLPPRFFKTPARIIPWQIRDEPFVICLAMDWCAWGQLGGREPRWRTTSLSAWHFTEKQLKELT